MKRKYIPIVLIGLILLNSLLFAQTTTLDGQVITGDATWSGTVIIEGDVTIAPYGSLVILPGTRVLFRANKDNSNSGRDKTKTELIVKGTLIARGTINNKIWFSSTSTEPRMSDWCGIQISNPKHTSIVEYVVVEYAFNGITIKKCNPQITNSQLQFNYNAGLTVELGSRPKIIGNIISENGYAGVICNTGARPVFTDNMITKNEIGLINFGTAQPNLGNMKQGPDYSEGRNGLFDNRAYNIHNHSIRDILAENSSWGTKDLQEIAANIYDTEDESKYGQVDVSPILGGSIDIEQKIILSQATQDQALLVQEDTTQQVQTVMSEGEDQTVSLVADSGEVAIQPQISETSRLSISKDSEVLAAESKAPPEPKQQVEAPSINYDQIFLDAFLDENRIILKKKQPVIRDSRRGMNMHGKIIVRAVVDRMGNVESATVLRGLNLYYDNLSIQAAKKFIFKAGTINGNPVRFSTSLFFEF